MSSIPGKLSSRLQALCPILGKSEDLKRIVIPTTEGLLNYYLRLKHESDKEKLTGLISKIVDSVIEKWETSLVPIASKPHVSELLKKKTRYLC